MSTFYNFIRENHLLAIIEAAAETRSSVMNLSQFELTEIPTSLLNITHLEKVYLDRNSLTNLPSDLSKWEYLKTLTLDYNNITSHPGSIGKLVNLVYLNLSYNPLKHLMPEIGLLTKLEVLWLNHTSIEFLPPEIEKCEHLDTLGARGNFIRVLPTEIIKLKRLRWLTLEANLLSEFPNKYRGLSDLRHLNLSNNQFVKFPALDEMKDLDYVFLSRNFITEVDPQLLNSLTFIKKIDLRDNPLSNSKDLKKFKNICTDEFEVVNEVETSDTDSEDWEESTPSSELDMSETSEEDVPVDEPFVRVLPNIARFVSAGI